MPGMDGRDNLAGRLRTVLAPQPNVREVHMFGGLSFMVDDRLAVAAGSRGDLLVHIDPARYEDLLDRGAEAAVMGSNRPMGRNWLTVPWSRIMDDEELAWWVAEALTAGASGS